MTSRDRPGRNRPGRQSHGPGGRRVYLHIGEPKTGTSFLQQALWSNRRQLAAQGLILPGYSTGGHARASQDLRGVSRLSSDPTDPWVGEWEILAGQARRARQACVISNELLAACGPGQADRAVRSLLPAQLHVILTVRDFAALLPAEWQETVKTRGTASWDDWLASVVDAAPAADRRRRSWFWRAHDTLATLGMWTQHIPPDQVHVITVPRDGMKDELWLRFASVLGVESDSIRLPQERANSSLGLVETEFLRRLNEALPDDMPKWFYTWNIKRILAHDVLDARERRERLVVPPDRVAWAREQSESLVAGLRESKYHIVGDLDELLPPPIAQPYLAPADLPAERLLDAAVHAAAALADREYRRDIISSGSDFSAITAPARRLPGQVDPGRPGGLRHRAIGLAYALLARTPVKRILYSASRYPAARRLRIIAWSVLTGAGRRL